MATKKAIAKNIVQEFSDLESRRKNKEKIWIDNYKKIWMYRNYTEEEQDLLNRGITADVKQARHFSHFETKRPRISNTIFSYDPIMRALIEAEDSIKTFKVIQTVVNKFLRNGLHIPFNHALTQSLYTSVGWVGFNWDSDEYGGEVIEKIVFEMMDTFNTYVADTILERNNLEILYRRMFKKRSYLEKSDNYKGIDKIKVQKSSDMASGNHNTWAERMDILNLVTGNKEEARSHGAKSDDDIIEIVERWEKDRVVTIANRTEIIRDTEHIFKGFLPFYPIRNYPSDSSFYGMDEVSLLADLPEYADEMKNLRLNIERRVAWPAALVSRKAKIKKEDLVPKPHQVIKTYDMDGYREVQRPDVKGILLDEEFISRQDMENSTGLFSYLKGGAAPRAETATTALTMKEAGMERIMTQIFHLNFDFFKPMCRDMTTVLQDKLDAGIWIAMAPEGTDQQDISKVAKADIQGYVDWILSAYNIKSVADTNLQQNFIGLYDRLSKSTNIDKYELDKKALEVYDFKNIDDLMLHGPEAKLIQAIRTNEQFGALILQAADNPQLQQILVTLVQAALQKSQGGGVPGGQAGGNNGTAVGPGVANPAGGAAPRSMGINSGVGGGEGLGF